MCNLWHNFQVVDNGQYLVEVDVCTALNIAVKHISGVMVSVLVSSVVDRGSEPRSGKTKDYKIGICCSPLSTQH